MPPVEGTHTGYFTSEREEAQRFYREYLRNQGPSKARRRKQKEKRSLAREHDKKNPTARHSWRRAR